MCEFWNISITDIVQALCALGTIFIAIVTYYQGREIKTLTDVVKSLNEQTKVSQQLLSFEIRTRMKDQQPLFKTGALQKDTMGWITFTVINSGTRARNVDFEKRTNLEFVRKNNLDNKYVGHSEAQAGTFKVTDFMQEYAFNIIYEDDFGKKYKQKIVGNQGRLRISLPTEIEF